MIDRNDSSKGKFFIHEDTTLFYYYESEGLIHYEAHSLWCELQKVGANL